MIFKDTLLYLAEKSGIPVWILNDRTEIAFSTVQESHIGDREAIRNFFSVFTRGQSEVPLVRKFDSGELYGSFPLEHQGGGYSIVIGPAYEIHPYAGGNKGAASILFCADSLKGELLMMSSVTLSEFCRFVSVVAQTTNSKWFSPQILEKNLQCSFLRDIINKQLVETIFDIREEGRETAYALEAERKILSYVKNGDVEALQNLRMPRIKDLNAKDTKLQNLFDGVALITLATRAAIDGGLDYIVAFSLSDLYFKRLSNAKSEQETENIIAQVLPHFAQKVREANIQANGKTSSPYIVRSIRYIRLHLHTSIRLEDVAREVGLEAKYFSRLFVMLTGEKFSAFVQREKIAEAKSLLENTDRTVIDVSNSLGFSSQSYFIKVFTRYAGETPGEFLERKRKPKNR